MTADGPGRPAAKMTWAEIAFQSSTASARAEISAASSAASVIRMSLCFIIFGFFLLFGDERLVCCVTGPRRFSPPDHANDFEIFPARKPRLGKAGEDFRPSSVGLIICCPTSQGGKTGEKD